MMLTRIVLLIVSGLMIAASDLYGQAADVTGTVADQSGSRVAGAKIRASNLETGVTRETESNDQGNYMIRAMLPGRYRLWVESQGFKASNRGEVVLAVDQVARIDFTLEVGSLQETVNVEGSTVLLEAATATLGTVVENRQITELPLNGRNPIAFVALAGGVRLQGGFGAKAPGNYDSWGNFSVNGGLANANSALIEGLPLDYGSMNGIAYIPPVDATQEFRIQTNNFSAEYGRSAGAVINFSIKSGTNQLHGSAYEFLRNKSLDANNFFQNRVGNKRPALTQNQFGASMGGPIKKDKTFFFGNYEGYVLRSGTPAITTVPTALERAGNFSQTRNAAGAVIVIADALTTRQLADGSYTRTPFSGNVIPSERFDPAGANLAQVYGLPNIPAGNPITGANNYSTQSAGGTGEHQGVGKIDHNLSDRWKVFGSFARVNIESFNVDPFKYKVNLTALTRTAMANGTITVNGTLSPSLILTLQSGYARYNRVNVPYALGFDLQGFGFSRTFADSVQQKGFPHVSVNGLADIGGSASSGINIRVLNSWSERAALTWVRGNHVWKFGGNYRVQQLNGAQNNFLTGRFTFQSQFTSVNPNQAAASGVPLASMLLGYLGAGDNNVAKTDPLANQRKYAAMFFQDDWKVTRKLTLNLGFEYSFEIPITERFNRKMWFDQNVAAPIGQATGLPLRGGFYFSDKDTRSPNNLYTRQAAPRFGFAYQAAKSMVVRGGYGLFWLPAALSEVHGQFGSPAWNNQITVAGSLDSNRTPNHTLRDPFPNGIPGSPGSSLGLSTLLGQNAAVVLRNRRARYMQQWNLDIQKELGRGMVAEIAYAGSKGTGLPGNYRHSLNQLPASALALGTTIQQNVPNPFFGRIDFGALSQATTTRGQLLRPFPHYLNLYLEGEAVGHSIYHSAQAKFTKRFSGSLVQVNYTFSKGIGDSESRSDYLEGGAQNAITMGFMDQYNRGLERGLNLFDNTHRFVVSYSWELPFGTGKAMAANWGPASYLVSGWQVTGVYTAESGNPLPLSSASDLTNNFGIGARPNNNGTSARITGDEHGRLNRWFDTSVFSQAPVFTYGTTGRVLPDMRSHGVNNIDAGFFKNNKIGERFNLQFRAETFNLLNRVRFGYPGLVFGNAQFGIVSSQRNSPRNIQLGLKLLF